MSTTARAGALALVCFAVAAAPAAAHVGIKSYSPKRSSGSVVNQTYQRGERVKWTGARGSDTPAPRVTLTAAEAD
jgi:hypothetical protein